MNAAELDPAVHAWASRIAELSEALPGLGSADFTARRAAERLLSDALAREFTAAPTTGVDIHDERIRAGSGELRIRRYVPRGLEAPAPTQLSLHGGGFVSGTIDELINDSLLTARAASASIQVVALEYRLAPEHPYPAAVDDAVAALDALRADPDRFGADARRLGIGGASAGGGIAAGAALALRDRGDSFLVHQHIEVPALSLTPFGASAVEYARGFGLDGYEGLADVYLGPEGSRVRFADPLEAPALDGLPPTFIQAAEHDPLRDAALAYGTRLSEAGVPALVEIGHGHVHGSPGLTATFGPARQWQRRGSEVLRAAYHPDQHDPA